MIKNLRTKKIISNKEHIKKCAIGKSLGLMFSKPKTLIFIWKKEKLRPIHMFFVFFPIDLIYLNKKKEVIEIKRGIKPFTFHNPKRAASILIEAPVGKIKGIQIGDKLTIK